jgi:surfactin synthase thioesterase subunit/glycosyltransferase involved in cell wall biosynthesis
MRILLAQNSLYYPAHGGGDKSNRLLMEALAARGHECAVVARIPVFSAAEQRRYEAQLAARGVWPEYPAPGVAAFERAGVAVRVVVNANLRACFEERLREFAPDVTLCSTDDPAQTLLEAALGYGRSRVVYLARAGLALPFGPDCAFPSEAKTARIRMADRVVGVSEYVARYIRQYGGIEATHVPISLMEPGEWPALGRFENEWVTMVNPCAVKGISIFLALADAFPRTAFAAVPTWGANAGDRAALAARPNIRVLEPVDDINRLLERTRTLLVPSLWAEARSRVVLEAMLRGVPVLGADVGGIPEAMMGVPYLLPVRPIEKYQAQVDEQMVPVAEVPPQDLAPWREALGRLLGDRAHYQEISRASRAAALEYASRLTAEPFEGILFEALVETRREVRAAAAQPKNPLEALSPDKRKLLAVRLRQRAPAAAWFPGAEETKGARLFCFPWAGGGAAALAPWRGALASAFTVCPVRLPGRESRAPEAPFERMAPLVEALAAAIRPYLGAPFAFFGHSMGAAVAFELARSLRRAGAPLPAMLIASGAKAPRFRKNWVAPPDPTEAGFLAELRRLDGLPAEALEDPALLRAILPALTADAALYRRYVYSEEPPLSFPIRAYGGFEDPNVKREHLEGWRGETTASFAVRQFPGGHFYVRGAQDELLAALAADLKALG